MDAKTNHAASIRNAITQEYPNLAVFRNNLILCYRALDGYAHVLEYWKEKYAPLHPGDAWHSRYREARKMLPSIQMILDSLTAASFKERYAIVQRLMEDDCIIRLQEYISPRVREIYCCYDCNAPQGETYLPG